MFSSTIIGICRVYKLTPKTIIVMSQYEMGGGEKICWYQENWFRNLVVGSFIFTIIVFWFFFLVIVPSIANNVVEIYKSARQDVAKYCGFSENESVSKTSNYGL